MRFTPEESALTATRASLVQRLGDWQDGVKWQEFFDTYSKLIYSVARRAGLTDAEAQDVVQETTLAIARNIERYDAKAGPFKPWLLQMTRWRIADQFRKRLPVAFGEVESDSNGGTATIDRIPAPERELEGAWDEEWRERLLESALERLKRKVKPEHFQIFDCAFRKQWPVLKIARELGVNAAQVYLVKHRVAAMLKKELKAAEGGCFS